MKPTLITLVLIIVTGCSGNPTMNSTATSSQTRAVAGDCIYEQGSQAVEAAALTGALEAAVGGIITGGLNRIGAALRAVGEPDADTVIGRYAGQFEPGNPPNCILIAKGSWTINAQEAWTVARGSTVVPVSDATGNDRFKIINTTRNRTNELYLTDPDFVLELVVVASDDRSALRLIPSYFEYHRMVEDKMPSRGSVSRGIAVQVAAHAPGKGPKDQSAVGDSLVLGDMETGYRYFFMTGERSPIDSDDRTKFAPFENTTGWFPTFTPPAPAATNTTKPKPAQGAGDGASATGSTPSPTGTTPGTPSAVGPCTENCQQLLPRTLTVTLAETRKPRKVLLFLADVFDASKDELETAAELALIKSKQTQAELEAAQASNTLMTDFVTKLAAAEVAIHEYCAVGTSNVDRLNKSSQASIAQHSANLAALAASQPQPYTSFIELSTQKPEDSGFCS